MAVTEADKRHMPTHIGDTSLLFAMLLLEYFNPKLLKKSFKTKPVSDFSSMENPIKVIFSDLQLLFC